MKILFMWLILSLILYVQNFSCQKTSDEQIVHSDYGSFIKDEHLSSNRIADLYERDGKSFKDNSYIPKGHNALRRPAYMYENTNSYSSYVCDENSPYYTPNHPKCMKPEDKCNETAMIYMPNHPDCADKCDKTAISYQPNHPDCPKIPPVITEQCQNPCDSECENFDPQDPLCIDSCDDPCDPACSNFDLEDLACIIDPLPPVCEAMITGINTTLCKVSEEYQALTCGECPDVEIDIKDKTEACRNPSPDLIDCMASIGTVEKNGQACKMFEFKFMRSTMSPKCEKPKDKYPSYSPKHAPIYRKPQYQKQIRTDYRAPKKLFHYPKKMVTVLQRHYW